MSRLVGWLSLGRSVFFPVKPVLGIPVSLLVVPPSAFVCGFSDCWVTPLIGFEIRHHRSTASKNGGDLPPDDKHSALKFSVMTRKGRLSVVTQNYPYVVRVVIPAGAWRDLNNMHEFHVRNGIAERNLWCQAFDDSDVRHWRFEKPAYAEFFIAEFGGELLPSLPTGDLAMMRVKRSTTSSSRALAKHIINAAEMEPHSSLVSSPRTKRNSTSPSVF